jgi:hypothetical protein
MGTRHVVEQGECVSSIALAYGMLPDTIWKDDENRELRALRGSGQVLLPGDVLIIPEREERVVEAGVEKRHRFRRKGVPEMLRLRFYVEDEPLADLPCTVDVDGVVRSMRTDAQGGIEVPISPDAQRARVSFEGQSGVEDPAAEPLVYEFALGGMDPITQESGVRQRLDSLHLLDEDGELEEAVRIFQEQNELPATGIVDEATRSRLAELTTE